MPTWPSSNKASTQHVDSGSDKPRLARADLKKNIDNTNSIIDMFNITSPQDQQILMYDSANARFDLQNIQKKAFATFGTPSTITVNLGDNIGLTDTNLDPYDLVSTGSTFTITDTLFFELFLSTNIAQAGGGIVSEIRLEDSSNTLIQDGTGDPTGLIMSGLLTAGTYKFEIGSGAGGSGARIAGHVIFTKQ